jgi:hypothetical protein
MNFGISDDDGVVAEIGPKNRNWQCIIWISFGIACDLIFQNRNCGEADVAQQSYSEKVKWLMRAVNIWEQISLFANSKSHMRWWHETLDRDIQKAREPTYKWSHAPNIISNEKPRNYINNCTLNEYTSDSYPINVSQFILVTRNRALFEEWRSQSGEFLDRSLNHKLVRGWIRNNEWEWGFWFGSMMKCWEKVDCLVIWDHEKGCWGCEWKWLLRMKWQDR